MTWSAEAPSNIALIKYMGKTNSAVNEPSNASLSWTIDSLRTRVELEQKAQAAVEDEWQPLLDFSTSSLVLSDKGQRRFLDHLGNIKREVFAYSGHFLVRSANNFPADCGLASSASSFAALTRAAVAALSDLTEREPLSQKEMANLSRRGSGSSCRSFFSPWAIWHGSEVESVDLPYDRLFHLAVIAEDKAKAVSSSEAHKKVTGSDLFPGRPERANQRLRELLGALHEQHWPRAFQIIWAEFWDMHALFETCPQPFGYMNRESLDVLNRARQLWTQVGDGPWVTMDAGPNVHLLFRPDQEAMAQSVIADWGRDFRLIAEGEKRGRW